MPYLAMYNTMPIVVGTLNKYLLYKQKGWSYQMMIKGNATFCNDIDISGGRTLSNSVNSYHINVAFSRWLKFADGKFYIIS